MTKAERRTDRSWAEKSAQWAKAAPETVSINDAENQLLIERAGIQPGDAVLDLASGTGEPAISIALHVGATGSVTATDATPGMLDVARRRTDRLVLDNMSFEVCAMEDLPFDDRSFDAVTCRFGLMHADDAVAGLKQARRVLRPGKRAACMVHGPSEQWTVVNSVAAAFFEIDGGRSFERHFKFSGDGEAAKLFRSAGFVDVHEEEVVARKSRKAGDVFWSGMLNRGYGDRIDTLDETLKAELNARFAAAFRRCLKGDTYHLLISQRVVVGTA